MRLIFILALFLLPFIELWGLFRFGAMYGWWFFLYIVVMAILGWQLIQDEKALVLGKLMGMMTQGGNIAASILGSAKNLLAGALFLFPGILSHLFRLKELFFLEYQALFQFSVLQEFLLVSTDFFL